MARVTIVASRAELLNSQSGDADCTSLHALPDAQLPMNVARLTAVAEGASSSVRYQWAIVGKPIGTLAADMDIATNAGPPAVQGLCAEFGNGCTLTQGGLTFYTQPSILWIAPTCDAVQYPPSKRFPGGAARLRVKAFDGKRKLGKAKVTIGYGHIATVTLFANGKTGLGKPSGILTDIAPVFEAIPDDHGVTLPPVDAYQFANGAGGVARTTTCADPQYAACADSNDGLLYSRAGKFVATVQELLTDGSAVCDNIGIQVATCSAKPVLQVVATPRPAGTYKSGQTIRLRVRLHNESPAAGGCNFLLTGAGVLGCSESVRVGGSTDTKTTSFDLPHCIGTGTPCRDNSQCGGATCVNQSHCTVTLGQTCVHDSDCRPPACPTCGAEEGCTHLLASSTVIVPVGQTIDLLDEEVVVTNLLPDTATLVDGWTVNTFNAGSDDATTRYRIHGTKP